MFPMETFRIRAHEFGCAPSPLERWPSVRRQRILFGLLILLPGIVLALPHDGNPPPIAPSATTAPVGPSAWPPPPELSTRCPVPDADEHGVEELRAIYRSRKWRSLRAESLRLHLLEGSLADSEGALLLESLTDALRRLEAFFDHGLTKPADVFVYGHPASMDGPKDGTVWPRLGAVFSSYEGGASHRLRAGAGHLLAHLFARTLHPTRRAQPLALLEEGVARMLERRTGNPHAELAERLRSQGLPPRPQLNEEDLTWGAPLAAEKGHSLVSFIREGFGSAALLRILRGSMSMSSLQKGRLEPLAKAVRSFLHLTLTEVLEAWARRVEEAGVETALAPEDQEGCRRAVMQTLGLPLQRVHFAGRDSYRRALAWAGDGRWLALREGRHGWELVRAPRARASATALDLPALRDNRFFDRVMQFYKEQAQAMSCGDVEAVHRGWSERGREGDASRGQARRLTFAVAQTRVESIRPALLVESTRFRSDGSSERVLSTLRREEGRICIVDEGVLGAARPAEVARLRP